MTNVKWKREEPDLGQYFYGWAKRYQNQGMWVLMSKALRSSDTRDRLHFQKIMFLVVCIGSRTLTFVRYSKRAVVCVFETLKFINYILRI